MITRARVAMAVLLFAPSALADSPAADKLFNRGVELLNKGDVPAACEKFSASYALDPATGTLYNLANCHERQGRLLEAHAEFLRVAAILEQLGKQSKAQVARSRAEATASKLPRYELSVRAGETPSAISLDGKPLARDTWRDPIFVEAGSHTFSFEYPGHEPIKVSVQTREPGQATLVEAPQIPAPAVQAAPPKPKPSASAPSSGGSTLGWIVVGTGGALMAAGAVFGVMTLSQKTDAEKACGGSAENQCTGDVNAANDTLGGAKTSALLSTLLLGVGAVGVGTGVVLLLTDGRRGESKASGLRIAPTVGLNGGGAVVAGRF